MLTILVTILHVIASLFLIAVVLLQTGKRADLAGAFGGGGSQTAFGARGAATVLSKATTIAAVIFMFSSLTLAILTTRGTSGQGTVLDQVDTATPPPVEQPAGDAGLPPVPQPAGTDTGSDSEPLPDGE